LQFDAQPGRPPDQGCAGIQDEVDHY
jgi:hypothetical protein